MVFFTDAEPTNLCDGIVGGSSFYNIPVDVKRDIVFDEFSDIFTESGSCVVLILSVDVRHVLSISGFHKVVSATSVCFPVVSIFPGDSCLVHQVVHLAANAREDFTCFRLLFRATGTSIGLGCCSIVIVVVAI